MTIYQAENKNPFEQNYIKTLEKIVYTSFSSVFCYIF